MCEHRNVDSEITREKLKKIIAHNFCVHETSGRISIEARRQKPFLEFPVLSGKEQPIPPWEKILSDGVTDLPTYKCCRITNQCWHITPKAPLDAEGAWLLFEAYAVCELNKQGVFVEGAANII